MRRVPQVLAVLAAGLWTAGAAPAIAGTPELLGFVSVTPASVEQLARRTYSLDSKVRLAAELRLPAAGPVPVVVIMASGEAEAGDRERAWADRLAQIGIGSLRVDSFQPRGLQSQGLYFDVQSIAADIADALAALQQLLGDPRVDPKRIAIMGAMRGGSAALATALEPLRRGGLRGEGHFAAHIALQAGCDVRYLAEAVDTAPVLFVHGAADDVTPAQHCREYADWFARAGAAVQFVGVPEARHDFDRTIPAAYDPQLETARGCDLERNIDTGFDRRLDTGELVIGPAMRRAYEDGCRGRGGHRAGNAAASAAAGQAIERFLREVFRLAR